MNNLNAKIDTSTTLEAAAEAFLETVELINNQSWLAYTDRAILVLGSANTYSKRLKEIQEQISKEARP